MAIRGEAISTPSSVDPAAASGAALESVGPRTRLDRAADALRSATDIAVLALLGYDSLFEAVRWRGVAAFWVITLGVFPYPRVAEQLRRRPETQHAFFLLGLALMVFGAFGPGLFGGSAAPSGKDIFRGLMLVLAGGSIRLYVNTRPGESMSLGRLLLGIATLAAGALSLWLAAHPTLPKP